MSDLGHVLVLAGGVSFEREVSLASARRVIEALRRLGVDVDLVDVDASVLDRLTADPPDAVFIAMHGSEGEDGALRELLDLAGVPYVGATAAGARLAFDKTVAKAVLQAAGVAAPRSIAFSQTAIRDLGGHQLLDRCVRRLGLPLVVKPARGGSALGVTIVREATAFAHALVTCFAYDTVALVEQYVVGTELAISVVEDDDGTPRALPPVEIRPVDGMFDYAARYTAGMTEYHVPARITETARSCAVDVALLAHQALGLRDLSRTDVIVTADDEVLYLETNVAPGMTPTSLLPMAAAEVGIDLGTLCRDLLVRAATRGPSEPGAVPSRSPQALR